MSLEDLRGRLLKYLERTHVDPKTVDSAFFANLVESQGKSMFKPDEINAETLSFENQSLPVKTYVVPVSEKSSQSGSYEDLQTDVEDYIERNPKLKRKITDNKYDAVFQFTSDHKLELTIGFFAVAAAAAAGYFYLRKRGKKPKEILIEERKLE